MELGTGTTLLAIGPPGSSLTVDVRRQETRTPGESWFDAEITADAFPFGGTIETVLTLSDLREWGEHLSGLAAGTGRVVLGGERAAELVIEAERQEGARSDLLVLSVEMMPSETTLSRRCRT